MHQTHSHPDQTTAAIRPLGSASAALAVLLALAAPSAQAATRYWDGGSADIVANGDGNSDGTSGTWNTILKNWDQGSGLAHVAWVNGSDVADINGFSQTLTLGTNIILGGIVQKSGGSSIAIAGGSGPFTLTLNITGANTFLGAANDTTGRSLTVNAVIAGGVGKNLVIAGPATSGTGIINLGSANTFSGNTSFSAGVTAGARVVLNNQLGLQNSIVMLSTDANVVFNDSVSANAFSFGGLSSLSSGTGFNLALQNDASAPIALTVGGNNSTTTYQGVLSGGGSLIKAGSGTLTLTAANTYTGITTVSAGTLQVDGSTAGPTTVNNGATLAGSGTVNATVTVGAGGSLMPATGNLTVSNLTFSGTGTLNVPNLSAFTSVAAVKVNNALTVSGGAGAVTLNLPTTPGFNGIYHLIQFGSGIANTSGFTLGTVPTLAWNQTGALQVNGNYLDYVITAAGDTTPPTLSSILPANNSANVLASSDLVATFDETIMAGSGNIELRKFSDGSLVESFNVISSTKLTFSTTQLIINPTSNLPTNQTYYVLIPAGSIRDTSANNYAGITANTGWKFTVPVPPVLFTDSGSPANPLWSAILPTLNVDSPDPGPVYGSDINVNNAAVEVGLYGDRPISIPDLRIHVACHTNSNSFNNFTRWFQIDGNTHVLRVFVNDENTATAREGTSSHTEAFMAGGWNYSEFKTYEWTARYTIARLQQGYCCFQLKNPDHDWAVQLSMGTNGSLTVNNRTGTDVVVTNPDGSAKNFDGGGFDVRVIDDGLNYKLWIDGVLYADSSYSRPTGDTTFRWGMYFGANNLNPPSTFNIVLVSGAQVKSWPGRLTAATTTRTKDNNAIALSSATSWVGDTLPGIYQQALWNNTVTAANATTLASDQQWAGLRIVNPGGAVTINGSAILSLDDAGLDMNTATQNLDVNCRVQLTSPQNWNVATGRTATFDEVVSGYPGLTLNGAGTVRLSAANTYSGDTTVNAGTLVANNNSALSSGLLVLSGGNLSNTASCSLGNDINLNSNATINVDPSQTLTLRGALAGSSSLTKTNTGTLTLSGANANTGATLVSSGTLAVGNTSSLLSSSSLTLAGGTLLQPNLDGVVIDAPITVASSGTTATISAPTNNPGAGVVSTLTLRSVLAGSGNVTFSSSLNANALSTVYLAAPSTYTGNTLINTTATTATNVSANQQIIVKLGINNALPPTTVLTIDGGTGSDTGRFAELNLNGFNQQLAGLTNIPRSFTSPGGARVQRVVNSNVSAAATLTINNSSSQTFSGNLGSADASGSVSAAAMPGSTNGNNFGLTKSGVGTFTLTGSNTYSGDTTVNGGTLSLGTTNASNNSSTITLAAAAALLQLNFTGTDTVAKLFIGTSQKPAGTYGHSSTGATNGGLGVGTMNAYFTTGTGTLTVTSGPPSDYSSWAALNSTGQTIDLDHDGDGVKNGIEYLLGGNTNTTGFTALPGVTNATGTRSVTWTKAATYTGTYGTHFWVETSATLSGVWTIEPLGVNVTFPSATEVKYTFPAGNNRFARLKVTGP